MIIDICDGYAHVYGNTFCWYLILLFKESLQHHWLMNISKWVLSFQYEEKGYVKFTLMTILNVFSLIPEMWYIDNQVKENKS